MNENGIAIIGMSGRFSGCSSVEDLWDVVSNNRSCIGRFDAETLVSRGGVREMLADPMFVPAGGYLEHFDCFDSEFFDVLPREAQAMDPQHRLFLEVAWAGLEDAGIKVGEKALDVGVFAGTTINTYFVENVIKHQSVVEALGPLQLMIANDKDFLALRTSYLLNLSGPSLTVQTACSTSLAAVHMACSSILLGECNVALAGGASLRVPHGTGYLYQPGGTSSPDGMCRPFDARANGSVVGSGAGVVVLKRLSDAIRDRDNVRGVILSSALTNDGAGKRFFSMPSSDGQAAAIAEAQKVAAIDADSVGYVETHGTGTIVGDPIEFEGLRRAFQLSSSRTGYCALGSVKANIGHLDAAAGIAGLIKTVLLLEHKKIPAMTGFCDPNPSIDIVNSPFFIPDQLSDWCVSNGSVRRAGVTSIGLGGANVHVVLEEGRLDAIEGADQLPLGGRIALLSANTVAALKESTNRLTERLAEEENEALSLSSITRSLQNRPELKIRAAYIGESRDQVEAALKGAANSGQFVEISTDRKPVFLFPGQGSQYGAMGRELARDFPGFRARLKSVINEVEPFVDFPLGEILLDETASAEEFIQTQYAQPLIYTLQISIAQCLMSLGIRPAAVLGHSVGEIASAVVSGALSVSDGGYLAAQRGIAAAKCDVGKMLAVSVDEETARKKCRDGIEIAAINTPSSCVFVGVEQRILELSSEFTKDGVFSKILPTSHGFHSTLMEPAAQQLQETISELSFSQSDIPFYSSLTGALLEDTSALANNYWQRQIREPVDFYRAAVDCIARGNDLFVEVGPGQTLSSFIRETVRKLGVNSSNTVAAMYRSEEKTEGRVFLEALAECWEIGQPVEFGRLWPSSDEKPRTVSLPTYPFSRTRHWLSATGSELSSPSENRQETKHSVPKPDKVPVVTGVVDPDLNDLKLAVAALARVVSRDTQAVSQNEPAQKIEETASDLNEVPKPPAPESSSAKLQRIFEESFGLTPDLERALTEYGIDSLSSAQFLSRVSSEFEVEIRSSDFEAPICLSTIIARIKEAGCYEEKQSKVGDGIEDIEFILFTCRELLGIDEVRHDSDLLELGAHSLMLTQLTTRLRERFSVELKISEVFEASTPGGILEKIQQQSTVPMNQNIQSVQPQVSDIHSSDSGLSDVLDAIDQISVSERKQIFDQVTENL